MLRLILCPELPLGSTGQCVAQLLTDLEARAQAVACIAEETPPGKDGALRLAGLASLLYTLVCAQAPAATAKGASPQPAPEWSDGIEGVAACREALAQANQAAPQQGEATAIDDDARARNYQQVAREGHRLLDEVGGLGLHRIDLILVHPKLQATDAAALPLYGLLSRTTRFMRGHVSVITGQLPGGDAPSVGRSWAALFWGRVWDDQDVGQRTAEGSTLWRGSVRFFGDTPLDFEGAALRLLAPPARARPAPGAPPAAQAASAENGDAAPFTFGTPGQPVDAAAAVEQRAPAAPVPCYARSHRMFERLDVVRVCRLSAIPLHACTGPPLELCLADDMSPATASLFHAILSAAGSPCAFLARAGYGSAVVPPTRDEWAMLSAQGKSKHDGPPLRTKQLPMVFLLSAKGGRLIVQQIAEQEDLGVLLRAALTPVQVPASGTCLGLDAPKFLASVPLLSADDIAAFQAEETLEALAEASEGLLTLSGHKVLDRLWQLQNNALVVQGQLQGVVDVSAKAKSEQTASPTTFAELWDQLQALPEWKQLHESARFEAKQNSKRTMSKAERLLQGGATAVSTAALPSSSSRASRAQSLKAATKAAASSRKGSLVRNSSSETMRSDYDYGSSPLGSSSSGFLPAQQQRQQQPAATLYNHASQDASLKGASWRATRDKYKDAQFSEVLDVAHHGICYATEGTVAASEHLRTLEQTVSASTTATGSSIAALVRTSSLARAPTNPTPEVDPKAKRMLLWKAVKAAVKAKLEPHSKQARDCARVLFKVCRTLTGSAVVGTLAEWGVLYERVVQQNLPNVLASEELRPTAAVTPAALPQEPVQPQQPATTAAAAAAAAAAVAPTGQAPPQAPPQPAAKADPHRVLGDEPPQDPAIYARVEAAATALAASSLLGEPIAVPRARQRARDKARRARQQAALKRRRAEADSPVGDGTEEMVEGVTVFVNKNGSSYMASILEARPATGMYRMRYQGLNHLFDEWVGRDNLETIEGCKRKRRKKKLKD